MAPKIRSYLHKRIKRLVNDESLPTLDYGDFETCLDCFKGKQTNKFKKGTIRSTNLLDLIHTNICGPFSTPCFTGHKYFITFIDNYSRYGYIYLLYDKAEALNAFKLFKTEV